MSMALDISRALDPGRWFADAGLVADPWQLAAIRSTSKRQLWLCHRQSGKSTTAALLALARAQEAGSLVLLVSPSLRQSGELMRKVSEMRARIPGLPEPSIEISHKLEWSSGGRILSLPASEGTIRGYSKVGLLILDEASRIDDQIVASVRPMLAVSGGTMVCLSTPAGRQGFFFESYEHGGATWERTKVTAEDCTSIDPAFLQEERRTLGEMVYRSEYLCEFTDTDESCFNSQIIERAFNHPEVRLIWQ
jgi:hypothetical protein